MYNDFDALFKSIVKETKDMTMYQMDCFLHGIYKEYKYMIGLKGYDEDTFFSLVRFNDVKLADDNHVKRLMLDTDRVLEKYNRGMLWGVKNGVRYYNHFKRDNEGYWHFSYYEEKDGDTVRDYLIKRLLESARERLQKLTSMECPQIILDSQRAYVKDLMDGKLPIKGDTELLEETFVSIKERKGNGGKTYYVINDTINFFPNAKYGMYIKAK